MAIIDLDITEKIEEWVEEVLWLYNLKVVWKDESGESVWTIEGEAEDIRAFLSDLEVMVSSGWDE